MSQSEKIFAETGDRWGLSARRFRPAGAAGALATKNEWLDSDGMAQFDALHSRVNDERASACAFDLLMLNGDDLRRKPYVERKAALRNL